MQATASGGVTATAVPTSSDGAAEATRDYLYRTLYLRREYSLLTTMAVLQAARDEQQLQRPSSSSSSSHGGDDDAARAASSSAAAQAGKHDLRDVLLLPPVDGDGDDDTVVPRHDASLYMSATRPQRTHTGSTAAATRRLRGWPGLVFVRQRTSPWHGGCFAFTVHFPSRYPFECPTIELATPLPSHPLVRVVYGDSDTSPILQQEQQQEQQQQLPSSPLALPDAMPTAALDDNHTATTTSAMAARRMLLLRHASTAPSPLPQQQQQQQRMAQSRRRYVVPFEHIYCRLDPMHVSVMARVLRHVQQLFATDAWPASPRPVRVPGSLAAAAAYARGDAPRGDTPRTDAATQPDDDDDEDEARAVVVVDRVLAQRDVRQHSVTQEVVLGRPYTDYLCANIASHLAALASAAASATTPSCCTARRSCDDVEARAASRWAAWYTRHILPAVTRLP